jgi:hypothetical protein
MLRPMTGDDLHRVDAASVVRAALGGPIHEAASWLDWLETSYAGMPQRWEHVRCVWRRATELADRRPPLLDARQARLLELAALLHDVGWAIDPSAGQLHSFVGANLLDELGLVDLAPLVAHHSGARWQASHEGLAHLDRWTDTDPVVLSVLTYLDRTTGPAGGIVSLDERRRELAERYAADSLKVRAFDATLFEIDLAVRLLASTSTRC